MGVRFGWVRGQSVAWWLALRPARAERQGWGHAPRSVKGLEFRKNAFTSKRAEARVEATVVADLERYLTVEDILGLPSARWDRPRDAP